MKTLTFEVTVTKPNGCTMIDIKQYMERAIENWSKGGNPDDPLWDCEVVKIQVKK